MRLAENGDLLNFILKNGAVAENQARIWFRQLVLGIVTAVKIEVNKSVEYVKSVANRIIQRIKAVRQKYLQLLNFYNTILLILLFLEFRLYARSSVFTRNGNSTSRYEM